MSKRNYTGMILLALFGFVWESSGCGSRVGSPGGGRVDDTSAINRITPFMREACDNIDAELASFIVIMDVGRMEGISRDEMLLRGYLQCQDKCAEVLLVQVCMDVCMPCFLAVLDAVY